MAANLGSFEAIVDDYRRTYGAGMREEARWFGAPGLTFDQAIDRAALSLAPSPLTGALVLHPHQRRLGHARMEEVAGRLQSATADLRASSTFQTLLETIASHIGEIDGVGDLAIYDVAHRLGMYMGLRPDRVYLHAGTRVGARGLGLGSGRTFLLPADLPGAFRRLSPSEIEDVLCIYAADIATIAQHRGGRRRARSKRSRCATPRISGCRLWDRVIMQAADRIATNQVDAAVRTQST